MSASGKFTIESAGFSHVGMRRDHNEDAYEINRELDLYIVADGMGGHNSGEIASKLAKDTVNNFFIATLQDDEITWPYKFDPSLSDIENRLQTSIKLSNTRIFKTSKRNELYSGMGTTIVAISMRQENAYIANVGDSRCYVLRAGKLEQISIDHSLLNDYLNHHSMTDEEIKNFPHKNVIVRALGIKSEVEVDLFRFSPEHGDVFLLCSDGLSDLMDDIEIEFIMNQHDDLNEMVKNLVKRANQLGGTDNITTLVVRTG